MTARIPFPAHLRGISFHISDHELHGLGRGRLAGRDIDTPARGLRCTGIDLATIEGRCRAVLPLLGPNDVFGAISAARLLGLPLPWRARVSDPIDIVTVAGDKRIRHSGIRHFRITHAEVSSAGGLPVLAPEEVWRQLASLDSTRIEVLGDAWLTVIADALVTGPRERGGSRSQGLSSVSALEIAVREYGARRGVGALRRVLPLVRVGVDSPQETLLRLRLIDAGFPEPEVDFAVRVGPHRVLHSDLAFPQFRLLIEYEGDEHRVDRQRWQQDIERVRAFEATGWRVIRVAARDLGAGWPAFCAQLRAAIAAHA